MKTSTIRTLCCVLLAFCSSLLQAANPPPTQQFYIPFPEDDQLAGFFGVSTASVDPLAVFVTFSAATDGTVIYYDHWEDGYETDITNPTQPSTLVFGDGNAANGYPPGNAADLIPAGTVFSLRNYINSTNLSALDYDARDKVASYKPISLTKTSFPASTNTLLAGCVEVFEQGLWGTEYRVPIGVNMPTTTATATLAQDYDIFGYTALSIMAGASGATIQIDADNNGTFEQTSTLTEGQSVYVTNVNTGARILSDHPVQVILFSGRIGSNFQSRDTSLLPTYRWSNSYYAPVSTESGGNYRTVVFLYNPSTSAITVSYDYRSSNSAYTTASVSVPAGGNARVLLSPAGTNHSGAYRFYTTGTNPPSFYAMSAVDAGNTTLGQNQAYDGGFTLVGQPSLTTQVLLSLGIGRDPYSTAGLTENGNPLWFTTVGNGHTPETIYVDYNGDNAGPLIDPNGNRYDVAYSLRELQQQKLFDPDGDQSGMLVYSLNPNVKIAAAWAQDPTAATAGQPGLDVSTLVPPLREGEGGKRSSIAIDADGDGHVSAGDTLEYDIRGVNSARSAVPGPFKVVDNLPNNINYIPGSTRYRFSINGLWQAWTAIPDDGSGTPFPLDGTGFSVPGNLQKGQQFQVVFQASVKPYGSLSGSTITNSGTVEISPYGLVLPVSWTDTIYGSISDLVWNDLNGNGSQDAGELGIPNIRVFADLNGNGIQDAGEPASTSNSSGFYQLTGLVAGTYTIRVNPSDIAAANVGYGPTFDLDGVATSHTAVVTLAAAQDRTDADFGYRIGASVGDRVWLDLDGDGIQETGEPGINGVRVFIDTNSNGTYNAGEPNTITSGDGTYYIGNLNPGTYSVRIDTSTLPGGATQTYDINGIGTPHVASVTLIVAEHRGDLDFGYRGNQSIGDLVWDDFDANGTRVTYNVINGRVDMNNSGGTDNNDDGSLAGFTIIDGYVDLNNNGSISSADSGTFQGFNVYSGGIDTNSSGAVSNADDLNGAVANENPLSGVRVYLDLNQNGIFETNEPSAITSSRGLYSINNLFNGTYTVRVDTSTLPPSYVQTYDLTSPATDHTAIVTLSGTSRTDVDFGYRNDASLGDLVWNDRNNNGIQDPGEPGIQGVLVYIDANADGIFNQGSERFTYTDINGFYEIGNLPAGTYTVRIEISTLPQGSTQTHDFDGTGTANVAVRTLATSESAINVDFGYRANASFSDLVWNDANANGIVDGGETGIPNVRVFADMNGNGIHESSEPSALTNASGIYSIGNLVPGTYTARIDTSTLPAGFIQTYDATGTLDHAATFALSPTQTRTDIDFGYTAPITIGDFVWNDLDGDHQQDLGEPGIPNILVTLFNAANQTVVATTTTNSSGIYQFSGIIPGTYYVQFPAIPGFVLARPDQAADSIDSDVSLSTFRTPNFSLTGGNSNLTLDAGYQAVASIGNFVWHDTNANGQQDLVEPGLAGITVTLYRPGFGPDRIPGNADDNDPVAAPTTTGASGAYLFSDLAPGVYQVHFSSLSGFNRTFTSTGPAATDSDATTNGFTSTFVLNPGASLDTIDAGYFRPGALSGTVTRDTNNNGSGDQPLASVTLTLLDQNGNPVDIDPVQPGIQSTTITDSSGFYQFTGLRPASYRVIQTQPSGYASVSDIDGANNNIIGDQNPIIVNDGSTTTGNDFVEIQLGTISGTVRVDTDNNGSGDAPLQGVTLRLLDSVGNPVLDGSNNPITTTTDEFGNYSFTGVLPGDYCVVQDQPANYNSVSDVDGANNNVIGDETPITVLPGQTNSGNDFVEIELGTISGFVRIDTDNNGSGDAPLPGVLLNLLDGSGNPVLDASNNPIQVSTQPDGSYSFTLVPTGTYRVLQSQPAGYASVSDVDGANNNIIGDETPIIMTPGLTVTGRNFIEIQLASITGTVLADTNDNGTGDAPLQGVLITLLNGSGNPVLDGSNNPVTATTDEFGNYSFASLLPGTYQLAQTQPANYASVSDIDGGNPDLIGSPTPISLAPGQDLTGQDFVEIQPGTISGTVRVDIDDNGSGDEPLQGVTLRLLDAAGNPVLDASNNPITTTTDEFGNYSFTGVLPGDYCVVQDQPANYNSVSDVDGANNNVIGDETPITVLPGQTNSGNDFVEIELGTISGFVRIDTDNNGSGDAPLPGVLLNLLDGSGNPVLDASNNPIQVSTQPDGSYSFTLVPTGTYRVLQSQPAGYASVSDVDGANNNTIGDETPIIMTPGLTVTGRNFVEIQLASITGTVLADTNDNGTGDAPLQGVLITLLNGSGNPVLDGSNNPVTATTDEFGNYSFASLLPGTYQLAQTQPFNYASVSDIDGGNPDLIGSPTPISLAPGQDLTGQDFVEIQLGTISGFVFVDAEPLGGVTLTLLDENGNPILNGNGEPVTAITAPDGSYSFTSVRPGIYQVEQTQPFGYDSSSDLDGGNLNIIGDQMPIELLPGGNSPGNNFVETLDTCPDDWAEWKHQHPGQEAAGNPDLDQHDNLIEFAFALAAYNGSGDTYRIGPSTEFPGTIEAVFTRPKGATDNVDYFLEYSPTIGNPTAWQSLPITPLIYTVVDNGDCTETVTILDLETLTGLTDGKGVVRIRAELDEENDDIIDHTSWTGVEGWKETEFGVCCQTYSTPYLRSTLFTGTVEIGGVSGQTITLSTSAGGFDLATLLTSGTAWFAEITSGENEGHRFDIVAASGNTITLATDGDLFAKGAPFNTLSGQIPANIEGDTLVIRPHWTLAELFPPTQFNATDSHETADKVQIFSGGSWTIHWLYDNAGTPIWVDAADDGLIDQGTAVIPPGQGLFFNNLGAATILLAYGEVRENDFRLPHATGSNLVAGGYPIGQSPTGNGGRAMTRNPFFGSRDFKTADSFYVWKGDATPGLGTYDTYYLLDGAPVNPSLIRWVRVGDSSATSRGSELLLLEDRATFTRSSSAIPDYIAPSPWTP